MQISLVSRSKGLLKSSLAFEILTPDEGQEAQS